MLITNLLPLLSRYSLGFDLSSAPDGTVTLIVLPRKVAGAKHNPEGAEVRPISITASAAEIDAELAKGEEGALGQLIVARKSLSEQLAEQREAAEAAKSAKAKTAAKAKPDASASKPAVPAAVPAAAATKPGEPASLW